MLLNETPQSQLRYTMRIIKAFSKILSNVIMKKYNIVSPKISASGFEYDPILGDKSYPFWYWENALKNSGFEIVEYIDSGLTTVKNSSDVTLKHLICKKVK